MRERPTTSDEVLGEELGDDMFDVGLVGLVGDTGDRLVQSVPREAFVFGTAAILRGRARSRAGHLNTARA